MKGVRVPLLTSKPTQCCSKYPNKIAIFFNIFLLATAKATFFWCLFLLMSVLTINLHGVMDGIDGCLLTPGMILWLGTSLSVDVVVV